MNIDIPPQHQDLQPGIEAELTPQPEFIRKSYKGANKLNGKVALITGGDSGIGRAVAVHFAREGADVAISYTDREEEDAQKTKSLVEAEGRKCLLLPGDIRQEEQCKQLVSDTISQFGKLNILVNNAALQLQHKELEDIEDEDLLATYETNIYSFFRITKAAEPHLQKGDCIINTTSVTAYQGRADLLEYSSTKGAIMTFTRALSSNLITKGIRVNAVAPGPIWTPLNPASVSAEEVAEFGKDVPMKRPGQPSEVAPAYVFLASEDASYITGQVLHPNGGTIVNA
ncbi:SDR family oxidoreductase [Spirosoma fluviale]|uniref:NAD(P)-dependent dehydrogenase, short-chain alcohol dehydrogenase family n=1 Tax=Spirosoma fluviale TaxID=1597977 RepID=A0A286F5D1_9BACT|nr:SDR family oxidoreductase [Spirosoma fluviale]SOD78418.1 NAD(P)-dependent dehydrogenase, short-chain alcohol dehydrogenase family [Spirosoma fluviale]